MSDFKKKFGQNLKKLRKSRKLTQEKLAELIDIHYRQMSKIETGDNFPSSKTIEKLCCVLNVSPATLFNFDFAYEGEILMTGTGDAAFYKAIQQNNVITLEDYRGKKIVDESISLWDSDKRLLKIAQNLKKPLTVEYFENGKQSKIITYNPDGTIAYQDKTVSKEAETLMDLFKHVSKNQDYTNFVTLALKAIEDDSALEKLESMISGIKMARKVGKS